MIKIIGGQPYQKDRVRSMVVFCIHSLMPRLIGKLDITVRMSRNLCKETGNFGTCIWMDTNDRPREFEIEADCAASLRTLLLTVAHEMVHVKQFARNEQQHELKANKIKWMGKPVDLDKIDYWELPWEIEAHGREIGLFVRWCEHAGVENRTWTMDKNEM